MFLTFMSNHSDQGAWLSEWIQWKCNTFSRRTATILTLCSDRPPTDGSATQTHTHTNAHRRESRGQCVHSHLFEYTSRICARHANESVDQCQNNVVTMGIPDDFERSVMLWWCVRAPCAILWAVCLIWYKYNHFHLEWIYVCDCISRKPNRT